MALVQMAPAIGHVCLHFLHFNFGDHDSNAVGTVLSAILRNRTVRSCMVKNLDERQQKTKAQVFQTKTPTQKSNGRKCKDVKYMNVITETSTVAGVLKGSFEPGFTVPVTT